MEDLRTPVLNKSGKNILGQKMLYPPFGEKFFVKKNIPKNPTSYGYTEIKTEVFRALSKVYEFTDGEIKVLMTGSGLSVGAHTFEMEIWKLLYSDGTAEDIVYLKLSHFASNGFLLISSSTNQKTIFKRDVRQTKVGKIFVVPKYEKTKANIFN